MIKELVRHWQEEYRFNQRQKVNKELREDEFIYGNSFLYQTERSRFNPMRYIVGRTKFRRIDPRTVFIGKL